MPVSGGSLNVGDYGPTIGSRLDRGFGRDGRVAYASTACEDQKRKSEVAKILQDSSFDRRLRAHTPSRPCAREESARVGAVFINAERAGTERSLLFSLRSGAIRPLLPASSAARVETRRPTGQPGLHLQTALMISAIKSHEGAIRLSRRAQVPVRLSFLSCLFRRLQKPRKKGPRPSSDAKAHERSSHSELATSFRSTSSPVSRTPVQAERSLPKSV